MNPDVSRETLGELYEPVVEQIEIAAKYSGYIDRQKDEVERAAYYENLKLPADLDYMQVTALSIEVRQKLNKHRPETLGLASAHLGRDAGRDLLLLVHLKKTGSRAWASGSGRAEAEPVPRQRGILTPPPSPGRRGNTALSPLRSRCDVSPPVGEGWRRPQSRLREGAAPARLAAGAKPRWPSSSITST